MSSRYFQRVCKPQLARFCARNHPAALVDHVDGNALLLVRVAGSVEKVGVTRPSEELRRQPDRTANRNGEGLRRQPDRTANRNGEGLRPSLEPGILVAMLRRIHLLRKL